MMTPAEIMPLLRDLHPPETPGWWPPAPGWWLLAGLLALLALAISHALPAWRRRRRGHAALLALAALRQQTLTPATLSMLLKQVAITRFGRTRVAALHGRAWLEFLDETGGMDAFCRGGGNLLGDAPYRPTHPPEAVTTLAALAETWIRHVHDHTGTKP